MKKAKEKQVKKQQKENSLRKPGLEERGGRREWCCREYIKVLKLFRGARGETRFLLF